MLLSTGDSTDFKELVRSRTDLVELIGESIALAPQRGDRDYVGLCPFHDDNRPSMHVYRDRQTWRCWVCDKGGDCFSFVMEYERLDFLEALRLLAERAHLELPQTHRSSRRDEQRQQDLYEVLEWSCRQFHDCLLESAAAQPARDYLRDRGIDEATIRTFQIGFHPPEWQWLLNRARNRFDPQQLVEAQLAAPRAQGSGLRDHFYDRLLFPIHDPRGRCVAFGGRILPGGSSQDAPKYINSPESRVFPKSKLLYGLSIARNAIRESGCVVVVEGYTDCCLAHQFGQCNVVATLGTALTDSHVLALKRFARRVVLMYDGDSAGQNAMERSLTKFLAQDVDLRIMSLPGDTDPADFLIQHGRQAFLQRIQEATEVWDYKFNACLQTHGTDSIDARQRILEDMLTVVALAPGLQGTMREDVILGRLAQRLGISESSVRQRLGNQRARGQQRQQRRVSFDTAHSGTERPLPSQPQPTSRKSRLQEQDILEIIFVQPSSITSIRQQIGVMEFANGDLRHLLQICLDMDADGQQLSFDRLLAALEDPALKQTAIRIEQQAVDKAIPQKLSQDDAYLNQTISNMTWRREVESHEQNRTRVASDLDSNDLGEDARSLLQAAEQFARKRAASSKPTTH